MHNEKTYIGTGLKKHKAGRLSPRVLFQNSFSKE